MTAISAITNFSPSSRAGLSAGNINTPIVMAQRRLDEISTLRLV